jgi:hypothetical protein
MSLTNVTLFHIALTTSLTANSSIYSLLDIISSTSSQPLSHKTNFARIEESMTISVSSNPPRDCSCWKLRDVFKVSLNLAKQLSTSKRSTVSSMKRLINSFQLILLTSSFSSIHGDSNTYNARRTDTVKQ